MVQVQKGRPRDWQMNEKFKGETNIIDDQINKEISVYWCRLFSGYHNIWYNETVSEYYSLLN